MHIEKIIAEIKSYNFPALFSPNDAHVVCWLANRLYVYVSVAWENCHQGIGMESPNVEHLLQNYKVSDIVQIQKRLKSDVEKKRNDLKTLIGLAYNKTLSLFLIINNMPFLTSLKWTIQWTARRNRFDWAYEKLSRLFDQLIEGTRCCAHQNRDSKDKKC